MVALWSKMRRALLRFRDDSGVVLVEALLVVPLVMLLIAGMIESSVMMMQWNQTVKAIQVGGRLATVSSPLTDISALNVHPSGSIQGNPQPFDTNLTVSCGAGTGTACNAAALRRLMRGADDRCRSTGGGRRGICDIAPFIRPENVRITYANAGLGYVGRPEGAVVLVTLEMRNLYFDFFILGNVLSFFGNDRQGVPIPTHPVSLVSEDLADCESC